MADFGPLFNVITDPWFESEPTRIVWFTKLLRAVDGNGMVAMSRAKFGQLFNCTAKTAYYFLSCLEKHGFITLTADANSTKVMVCDIKEYIFDGRNLGAIWAQTNNCNTSDNNERGRNLGADRAQEQSDGRNLGAIWAQVTDNKSECYDTFGRNLGAIWAQNDKNFREEESKEKRKENTLSPVPPIIKEKIKEKKEEESTLPLRYAPDFVGDVSVPNEKDLEKQKKAEERKAKAAERKQKEATLVHKARLIFEAYYNELYDDSYYWTAKDAVAMKRLIKKITFGRTNRQKPLPCDDDSLLEALEVFLRMINKSWIMNNFSVNKIDSQYNDIVSEIKNKNNSANGNRNKTQQAASTAMLANQAANLLNDIAKADELYYRGEQGSEGVTSDDEAI